MENSDLNINKSFVILNVIQEIFSKIFETMQFNLLEILNRFLFINSKKLKIFDANSKDVVLNTSIQLAIGLLSGIILYYVIKKMFLLLVNKTYEDFFRFFVKLLIISIVVVNFSEIIDYIINFNFNISKNLMKQFISSNETKDILKKWIEVYSGLFLEKTEVFSFEGILKILYTYSIISFIFDLVIRFIMLKIIILIGPFAMMAKTFKETEYIFNTWIKTFFSLILMQNIFILVFQAIIFIPKNEDGIIKKLILICSIFVLIKINKYIKEMIGSMNIDIRMPMSLI